MAAVSLLGQRCWPPRASGLPQHSRVARGSTVPPGSDIHDPNAQTDLAEITVGQLAAQRVCRSWFRVVRPRSTKPSKRSNRAAIRR
jgi:hypothetical protein